MSLLLGVFALIAPYASAVAFVVVLAAYALTFGAAMLVQALELRRHEAQIHGDSFHAHLGSLLNLRAIEPSA